MEQQIFEPVEVIAHFHKLHIEVIRFKWKSSIYNVSHVNSHWKTPEGKEITAYERQHTWVIKGFQGTLKNPEYFIVLNPLSGEHTVSVQDFANHWKYFGYSGVVIK